MGKRVKKARSGHKEKRVSTPSHKTTAQHSISTMETVDDGLSVTKERKVCPHIDRGIDLEKFSSKIGSTEQIRCEDCREGVIDRRASKGRGKQGKKKGGGSVDAKPACNAIWVCLDCAHFSCGGIGFPTTPQSHAVRHARLTHHPMAIQFENLQLRWCFRCNMLIPAEKLEETGEQKDPLADILKLIKGRSSQVAPVDVEDVWLGSGSISSKVKSESTVLRSLDGRSGYLVRGLVNLGNTCFFNSVMQNLLAMNRLRDHFLEMDESIGPLTVSLKKLFVETNPEAGLRSVINPRSFFGCLCTKAPQFRGYQQHDSHELLRCLLDCLCTEELSARKRSTFRENGFSTNLGPTFIDAIFGGQLSSTVSCLECGHSSTVFEPFMDLSLPVPTKKPQSKRAQSISKAKKQKLPPKRSGRGRPKVNKDASSEASVNVSNPSAGGTSSHHAESVVPVDEKMGDALSDSAHSKSVGQDTDADKKSSDSSDLLTAAEFEKKPFLNNICDKTEASLDESTWLDYLEQDPITNNPDTASRAIFTAVTNDSGKSDAVQNGASLQDVIEYRRQIHSNCKVEVATSLENLTWLDYLDEITVSDDYDLASKVNDSSVSQDLGGKDADQNDISLLDRSGANSQASSSYWESNLEVSYPGNSFESEHPLQLQGSEVLLLPYKEESSTSGEVFRGEGDTYSSAVGCEPDSLDFDGFGDLFDEPEIAAGPTSDNSFQVNEVAETGLLVGNSSDSDPDEVDNSDSPVSIESCLAYFTKPDLLSKEDAWHCENCSKALQEQMIQSRKMQKKVTSKIWTSGVEDKLLSSSTSSAKRVHFPSEVRNLSGERRKGGVTATNESLVSDNGNGDNQNYKDEARQKIEPILAVSQSGEGIDEMSDLLAELTQSSSYRTCSQSSVSGEASDSCSVAEPSKAGCNSDVVQERKEHLLSGGSQSEGSGNEEIILESVKVKRDATKRTLINRTPPILTILLKRFSHDARGRLSKLNGHVEFREMIDLRPYIDPRCRETGEYKFRLLGVVEHQGSMRGGHYVAYVRGGKGNSSNSEKEENENGGFVWYHASDTHVRQASLEEVLRSEAYILFYENLL
ncbi:ubiquitin carboxyl-terminal hydrolase 2-like isoform X2 [Diospyros lotus]|uniref:ubiquitin carboxyl-terminal hydrolase 2-like isoform X2 n=1 Tax=Diospyros lotus TaxID=55363 RepID=UPI0022535561|nr:ubiquitin carboxyl-terminal hydrolase 2-like isoform X2 [Diospyros lotus]